jgi:hypothetical protein
MPLAIDKGFLKDLGKLEKAVYNRLTEVFDEFDAATHTGLANARNPPVRSIRINQAWRGIGLDTSTESSHTADHADFCVVDAQTSSFGGGGRERQRTGAATTKQWASRLATQQLGRGGAARVRQASA